jgi:sRNA-binding regulator protein Hfq
VFAEEIEAFLERLDAVGAVRIVANDAGEIERIYATTEAAGDDGAVRRAITSALMSRYNIHVDGWRVHVARLQRPPQSQPVPDCRLVRLEETLTETSTRVVVELGYERDGVAKTTSGSAQAPPGQAQRMRTVALAALAAVRPLLERAGLRPSLEGLMFLPFAGATVALAAVALASEEATVVRVGSETVAAGEAEAVVAAVLDAVRKPARPLAETGRRADPLRRFEGLRRHYERLVRAAAGEPSAAGAGPEVVAEPVEATPTAGPPAVGPPAVEPPPGEAMSGEPGAAVREGPAGEASAGATATGGPILAEIRPEREGGASIVMREEIRGDGPPGRAAPRVSMEDAFYRRLVAAGVPVHIRCRDGYEIPTAVIRDFGTYSLLVEVNGVAELVFKHGIIAIRPYGPLPPETPPS